MLLSGFAAVALLLAGLGTYGVIAYSVALRRYEIGVRVALGAGDRSVMLLVLREAVMIAAIGLVLGLGASALAGRALRSVLFGVSPTDPTSLAVTALLLVVVALLASMLPARRALRVDPLEALRADG
jgi:ABC-type antimicrobial peptide transport system permease subunit